MNDRKTIIIPFRFDQAKQVYVIEISNKPELWGHFQRLLTKGADEENLTVVFEPYNLV